MSDKIYQFNLSLKGWRGERAAGCFQLKGLYLFAMLILMAMVSQGLIDGVQGKAISHFKNPSSLIQSRSKRDTFADRQQQQEEADEYYDDNYDVLPDVSAASSRPPTFEDHISEKAKQIAESFSKMWQSLTDSIKHCVDAFRTMFSDEGEGPELTPEQAEQLRAEMEKSYRSKGINENEI